MIVIRKKCDSVNAADMFSDRSSSDEMIVHDAQTTPLVYRFCFFIFRLLLLPHLETKNDGLPCFLFQEGTVVFALNHRDFLQTRFVL